MTGPTIEIVPINLRDVLTICENMRQIDWEEVRNLLPQAVDKPDVIAMICMQATRVGFVAKSDGIPAGVIQLAEILDGTFRAGMFGTNRMTEVARPLVGKLLEIIPDMMDDGMKYCEALSDAQHLEAHKLLTFVGLKKRAILPGYGSHGRDIALFTITKDETHVLRRRWRKLHTSSGPGISPGNGGDPGPTGIS